jgi:hypothetical protein
LSEIKELGLWELTRGRVSTGTNILGADTFDEAVALAIAWIKKENPNWTRIGSGDIKSLKRLDSFAIIASPEIDEALVNRMAEEIMVAVAERVDDFHIPRKELVETIQDEIRKGLLK